MRLFQKEYVFLNDWGTITSAFWVKYPNELQPHVLRVDTLDLQIDEEKQQFVCRRLLSLKYHSPKWVQKFFGASPVGFAVEEATCSLKERKLTLKSCNYTFASFFRVEEACEYSPHPDNPQHTLYKQTATYKVSGLGFPVNRAVENAAVAQAAEKSLLGVSVVERLGMFLAEQQWRECCSSCLVTLEEAAVNASKHAQKTYRQLRQRVEKKLGVAGLPTDTESNLGEESDIPKSASCVTSDVGSLPKEIGPPTSYVRSQQDRNDKISQEASNGVQSTLELPQFLTESSTIPVQIQNDEAFQKHSTDRKSAVGSNRSTSSSEDTAEAECPCRLKTPSGRQPAPTSMWKDIRKKWRETAILDLRSPATSAASSVAASSWSGAVDFSLVRDVAAAAQCQQQQQHQQQSRPQAVAWRGSTPPSLGQRGPSQIQQRPPNRGYGLLFSSLGFPTNM